MANFPIVAGAVLGLTLLAAASSAAQDVYDLDRARRSDGRAAAQSGGDTRVLRPIGRAEPFDGGTRVAPPPQAQPRFGGYDDPRFERGM